MKIFIGNLPYEIIEQDLRQEFESFGEVESVSIIADKQSGRPKGFAFVEMASKDEAEAAIAGINGKIFKERTIVVNESRPRTDSRGSGGGSYGKRRSGGYGGGRGGYSGGGGRRQRY